MRSCTVYDHVKDEEIINSCYIPFVFTALCNAEAEDTEEPPKFFFSLKMNDEQTRNATYRRKNVFYDSIDRFADKMWGVEHNMYKCL